MFLYTVFSFDLSMYQIDKQFTVVRGKGLDTWFRAFVFVFVQNSCAGRLPFVKLMTLTSAY